MPGAYVIVTRVCGWSALVIGLVYAAVSAVGMAEGTRGFEIPRFVAAVLQLVVGICTTTAVVGWLLDHGSRGSVARDVQPLVRAEIERGIAAAVPHLAAAVADAMGSHFEGTARRVSHGVAAQNNAALREIVTGDLMQQLMEGYLKRAHRAGMVRQAEAAVAGAAAADIRPLHVARSTTTADEN